MPLDKFGQWFPVLPEPPPNSGTGFGRLIIGDGVPSNDLGQDGWAYQDRLTGDFYLNRTDVWNIHQGAAGGSGEAGSGSPEGVVTATPGTTYVDTTGHTFWLKETGSSNTGWTQFI